MKVINKNLDHLIPYANNSRTHSDIQIDQIAASLLEFGWCSPILIHNGSVVAGHGRLRAAKKLRDAGTIIPGWENNKEAPTIDLSHLSNTQRKAYILADNRIALNSGWDDELLSLEMSELFDDGFDIKLIGFTPDETAKMFGIDLAPGAEAPEDFGEYGEDIETEHCCPKCGYKWSGKSSGGNADE